MQVFHNLNETGPEFQGCIMTIGNFDGLHLAHQAIINKVVRQARDRNRKSVVMTFEPHPQHVLHPAIRPFYLITALPEKLRLIGELKIDGVILIPFSAKFARTTAREFIASVCDRLRPGKIIIGHDYTFGRGKEGKPEYLSAMGEELGFKVEVVDAIYLDGEIVSSTRIRQAIQNGDVSLAARLLGRPFVLTGKVIPGFRRGAGIGFPTANINPENELMPRPGVYAACVTLKDQTCPAVVNIGNNPTFANEQISIEAHLLGFCGDLYGKALAVAFIERLRDERKFSGPDELAAQIQRDIEKAREILAK